MTTSRYPRNNYMLPSKAALFDSIEFASGLETAGRAASFRAERYGEIGGCPPIALTKRTLGAARKTSRGWRLEKVSCSSCESKSQEQNFMSLSSTDKGPLIKPRRFATMQDPVILLSLIPPRLCGAAHSLGQPARKKLGRVHFCARRLR
jgi:hypothetical protein